MCCVQDFFLGLDKLEKNTTITMMWTKNNSLEVLVRADDSNVIYAKARCRLTLCLPLVFLHNPIIHDETCEVSHQLI